jgi:hypothetical protein
MATTDAKAGFRLPWSSDRSSTDEMDSEQLATADAAAEPTAEPKAAEGWPTDGVTPQDITEPNEMTETTAEISTDTSVDGGAQPWLDQPAPTVTPATAHIPRGKPSKFLADLTKAMQTAAEEARSLALSQLQAEAKTHIEEIHARSSTEAADLRRAADDDVAAVREWSKAEIARVREETEAKISDRKSRLEGQVENHASVIEREIEAVQATVAGFESDMATFFERLLAEEDPTQFATMAERLPEPPSFDSILSAPAREPESATDTVEDSAVEASAVETTQAEPVEETAPTEDVATAEVTDATDADATTGEAEAELIGDTPDGDTEVTGETQVDGTEMIGDTELIGDTLAGDHSLNGEFGSYDGVEGEDGEMDREAAFAAIQAAAEAAASAEVAADAASRAEAVADVAIEIMGAHGEEGENDGETDPRVAALGLSPDYDAAEAEALATADAADGEEIPEIGDDALAARLAGLVPNRSSKNQATDATATQVIVVGLVSVASIASFKRHLGRVPGVQSVGVSSGPDGEFVFAVNHTADVVLREAIPSLPSFQARVTGTSDGVVNVTAHDPES